MISQRRAESQFDAALNIAMLELARAHDQTFDSGDPHNIPELSVKETDQWGDAQRYSFGGMRYGSIGVAADHVSGQCFGWTVPKAALWLEQTTQRNIIPDDFYRVYRKQIADPYAFALYSTFAVLNSWRYTMRQEERPSVERNFQTTAWGYISGVAEAVQLQIKKGATQPVWRRLFERQRKQGVIDLLIEGQRIETIFARLGHSATGFSVFVSKLADTRPDVAAFRDAFPNE